MSKQTLEQALFLARTGKSKPLARACGYLIGCPEGGWPQTEQARARILDELPWKDDRDYTLSEFIAAAYTVDHAGRFRSSRQGEHVVIDGKRWPVFSLAEERDARAELERLGIRKAQIWRADNEWSNRWLLADGEE